jgi:hypothetical protein
MALVIVYEALGGGAVLAVGSDTPMKGNCWQTGVTYWCRSSWAGKSNYIYFRAIDEFSGAQPTWVAPAQNAVLAWSNAPGPQFYRWTSGNNYIYLWPSNTGYHSLTSNIFALTYNCVSGGYCSAAEDQPGLRVQWSDVYFNQDVMINDTAANIQHIFAHESGHAMGLKHNLTDPNAVMYLASFAALGPNSHDIGAYPGCASGGNGVNCIYGWGD